MPDMSDGEIARTLQRLEDKVDAMAQTQVDQAAALATLVERSKADRERHHELRDHLNQNLGGLHAEHAAIREELGNKADAKVVEAVQTDVAKIKTGINMAKGAAIAGAGTGGISLFGQIVQFFTGSPS